MSARPFIETCPLGCGAGFEPTRIVLPEGPLLRCRACGQQVSQATDARYHESMQEFDDPRGTMPGEAAAARGRTLAARRLGRVRALLARPADEIRLLDVGCSSGAFLMAARALGYRAEGVEPAPQAAAAARAAGLQVFPGTLQAASFPDRCFDAVTLFEVIEHLSDPVGLAREVHRVLRPGGIFLIGTANTASWTARAMGAQWEYLSIERHGGHVSFFDTVTMRVLAKRAGFRVARIETRNVRLFERGELPRPLHLATKLVAEALNLPARWLKRGHDMLAFLQRPE